MTLEEIKKKIREANDLAMNEALEKRRREIGDDMSDWCERLSLESGFLTRQILDGEQPLELGAYDRDEIARILNTDAIVVFDGYELDVPDGEDVSEVDDWRKCASVARFRTESADAAIRRRFMTEFMKYLHTGAAVAKSIGALDAMRLYLTAWVIVDRATLCFEMGIESENALRVVNLERVACERLSVGLAAAKLPKIKFKRSRSGRKAGRRSKSKKSARGEE